MAFFAVPINLAFGARSQGLSSYQRSTILEPQMSKRKPAKSSKRARSPAIATRAHVKKQAVVKSAGDNLLRSVAAGPIESPLELHDGPKEQAPDVEKQEAPIVRIRCQVGHTKMRGFDFASATGNMLEYQAKLLEMTQANMRFALDFSQKLATIRCLRICRR
jgi:hypothetical protein